MTELRPPRLFTPGPLTTSATVKSAMLRDVGSRDAEFLAIIRRIRSGLLTVADVSRDSGYDAVLMQGSGTFGVEAVVGSAIPHDGRLLVVENGAYGKRISTIANRLGIACSSLTLPENEPVDPAAVEHALSRERGVTHLAVVHCETTTGLINPVAAIAAAARRRAPGIGLIVDAMSSFGAIPIDLRHTEIDFLVSSSNKCIESVPGCAFVIFRRDAMKRARGIARSVSLDLEAQWREFEETGQFRFTPPTHALLAFDQALLELEAEGGVIGRAVRYARNHARLVSGMRGLGVDAYLATEHQGYIITSFRYPAHPAFVFESFYEALAERGFLIYPGKLSHAACFRIGTIGRLFESDIDDLLHAVREVLAELGVRPAHEIAEERLA